MVGVNRKRLLERTAAVWLFLLVSIFVVDLILTGFVRSLLLDVCIAVTAGVIIAIHRGVPPRILAVMLLLGITIPILALSYFYGGIHSPFLILIIFIPVAAFMLVSRPAGWIFTLLVCLYFVFLGLAPMLNVTLPQNDMGQIRETLARMGSFILVLCGISSIGWYYSRLYDRFYFSLKESNLELTNIAEYKSQFLASMSHEFRTPLNAIIGFSRRLLRSFGGELTNKDKTGLEAILRNGEMMQVLVNDVLEMARIENGNVHVHLSDCDLLVLVRHVLSEFEMHADAKQLVLQCNEGSSPVTCAFNTDADIVKKILRQLIANAIKYTEQGKVNVILYDESEKHQRVKIDVVDTGSGIEESEMEYLFDRFSRGRSRVRSEKPGTGLGLAITAELVEMLGGQVEATSRHGEGSRFSVILPVVRPSV